MTANEKAAIQAIRMGLGLQRLDPRRLFLVDDGAYTWIGDRADLTARDARDLAAIHRMGTRPDIATQEEKQTADAADYDAICSRIRCVSVSHGASAELAKFSDLPDDWRDGSALGQIATL